MPLALFSLVLASLAILPILPSAAADVPSPTRAALLDSARAGDWVEYVRTTRIDAAPAVEHRLRIEAIAVEARQVRLKSVDGLRVEGASTSTSFTELPRGRTWVELWRLGVRQSGADIEIDKVVAGRETLMVDGARLPCEVLTIDFSGARPDWPPLKGKARYWISARLPLQGIAQARIQTTLGARAIVVETRLLRHGFGPQGKR